MTLASKAPAAHNTAASLRDPHTLDELLNYRLLRLYASSVAPVTRLMEGRFGISRREWRLLALMARQGALAPSVLAERAHLDRPRTSRAIGSLVAKKLARRSAQPGDARRALVGLSDAGQRLFDEVFPQVAAMNTRVLEVIDEATLNALDHALAVLTTHATQLNRETALDVRADRRAGGSRRAPDWRPGS
jgi:DNA-binding MarR family transcriptional regulator